MSYLSARNADLEESMGNSSNSADAIAKLDKENSILLNLLGEKEEELENIMADLKDVKHLYQSQLESLYDQLAPSNGSKGTNASIDYDDVPIKGLSTASPIRGNAERVAR